MKTNLKNTACIMPLFAWFFGLVPLNSSAQDTGSRVESVENETAFQETPSNIATPGVQNTAAKPAAKTVAAKTQANPASSPPPSEMETASSPSSMPAETAGALRASEVGENDGSDGKEAFTDAEAADDDDSDDIEEIEEIEVVSVDDSSNTSFFPDSFDGDNAIRRDRGVNILTARPARRRSLTFTVDHRPFANPFEGKDAFFDFLGLDGNLKIGLGLRYGILDMLDIGIMRLNNAGVRFDTYEADLRWGFLSQEKHHIDMALRAGISWFAQRDVKDASGGFATLFLDRVFWDMLLVGMGFAYHSSSTNDEKSIHDKLYSMAIQALLEWRMLSWLAWTAEISASVAGYHSQYPAFSFAVKFLTYRHSFSLIFTNTQFIASDGMVANSGRGFRDIVFGFQIIREFNFGD